MKKKEVKMFVHGLKAGDKFEVDIPGDRPLRYELLYSVGVSRAHVRSLSTRRVVLGDGTQFDAPGERVNISTSTEVARIIRSDD